MSALDFITAILGVPLIAGAIGAAIRWAYLKEDYKQGLSGVLIGAFLAHYASLGAAHWFEGFADFAQVDPASARGSIAFMIGVGGVWPIQWIVDWGRRRSEMSSKEN